jgi:hypothetical protein
LDKTEELSAGTESVYDIIVTLTATDSHDRTSTRAFKVTLVPHADRLAFQLATGDGGNRDWSNGFWTDTNSVNPQLAANYLTQSQDIRTQSFMSLRLGPRIRMEWVLGGGIKAKAIYDVLPAYQDKTWREIFNIGSNVRFATKDTLASTPGKPLVAAGYIRNANGNAGQEVGLVASVWRGRLTDQIITCLTCCLLCTHDR